MRGPNRCHRARRRRDKHSGFTLIEMTLASSIMVMLVGSLALALGRMSSTQASFEAEVRLQNAGTAVIETVLEDLRSSAFVEANAVSYPHVFDAGFAAPQFAIHNHPPATKSAEPGDPDFGLDRELVFVLPDDGDGDGIPDLDGNGEIVWTTQELSYVLVTHPDGINALERRTDAAEPRTVARHVERLVFDCGPNSLGLPPTNAFLPFNTIRVEVWFRLVDGNGQLHTYSVQASTGLRNTERP